MKKFLTMLLTVAMMITVGIPNIEARDIGKATSYGSQTFDSAWEIYVNVYYNGGDIGFFRYGYNTSKKQDFAKSYSMLYNYGVSVQNGQGNIVNNLKGIKGSEQWAAAGIEHNGKSKISYKVIFLDVPNDYLASNLSFSSPRASSSRMIKELSLPEEEIWVEEDNVSSNQDDNATEE